MEIAKIAEQAAVTPQTAPKTSVQATEEKTNSTLAADNADKYVKSEGTFTPAYTKQALQKNNVESPATQFKGSVAQSKADHLASVVETLMSHQASKATGKKNEAQIEISGSLKKQIEEATGKKFDEVEGVQDESAEDYWGAEATAKRIFDFAKNLAGDDSALAQTLKDAFIKGFGLAEKPYGGKGKLPEVCYETYDRVIEMFDSWGNEKADAAEESMAISGSSSTEASAQ